MKESCNVSGIAVDSDWKDLQRLHQQQHGITTTCSVPVQVRWKDGKTRTNIDAASHRELLLRFMRTVTTNATTKVDQSSDKKRKRDDNDAVEGQHAKAFATENSDAYGWACVHNPAAVSHLAVIELGVDSREAADWVGKYISEKIACERSVLVAPTKWFQDSQKQPQSVSDVIMYKSPCKLVNKSLTPEVHIPASMDGLVAALESLLLSKERLEREGYPRAEVSGRMSVDIEQQLQSFRKETYDWVQPQDISLEDAQNLVQHFYAQTQSPRDVSPKKLPPFVVQPSPLAGGDRQRQRRIFAMDCEMVETGQGPELARVTLCQLKSFREGGVDIETELLFDTLVRPQNKVLNYVTQFSGMTATILGNEDDPHIVQLEQVQVALLATVQPDDIVVGHSLENDLRATRWIHTTVIDSAVLLRPKNRTFKFSLRHLAAALLNKHIQKSDGPHCSEEDAVTALHLAVRRALQGPSFCIAERPSPTNWLTALSQQATAICLGPSDWLHRHVLSSSNAVHALQCVSVHDSNGKAVASWLAGPRRRASIVWAKFSLRPQKLTDPSLVHQEDLTRLEQLLKDLISKLPPQAVLLMAIQPGYEKADNLSRSRRISQDPRVTIPWSEHDEVQWREAVSTCQHGLVLWVGGHKSFKS